MTKVRQIKICDLCMTKVWQRSVLRGDSHIHVVWRWHMWQEEQKPQLCFESVQLTDPPPPLLPLTGAEALTAA